MNEFRAQLMFKDIPIDEKLDGMIRKQECGDNVSYNQMGTHIFRQLNGNDAYNRVDKPNMNNSKLVAPDNSGKAFQVTEGPKKKKLVDGQRVDEEARHVTGNYVPRKGGTAARNDAFKSNLFNVIDQERSRKTGSERDYIGGFKSKNVS